MTSKIKLGKLYSEELGIKLKSKKESEVFKWFLASILFGHRISENIAARTYREFVNEKILTTGAILCAGWDKLVRVLDKGGFVRYDFSTADRLLAVSKMLNEKYSGKITNIHSTSASPKDLEQRLQEFIGIGPVTANIFLRELRTVWKKSDPEPLPVIKRIAKRMKVTLPNNRKTERFVRLEATLIRARH